MNRPWGTTVRNASSRQSVAHHIPRKRFGQHFLADAAVTDAIVRAIRPEAADAMVEIGPGLGALTRPLLERVERLTVIELDRDLAARLRAWPKLHVREADALKVDFRALAETDFGGAQLRVCGNLPYNISSPILFHLLAFAGAIRDQHFMLQKEVVDRMVAAPCHKDYGRLSVMLQWRYAMEKLLDVPPEAFSPPPRVQSAVVHMRPRAAFAPLDVAAFSDLVRVAFSQRRKLLRHTLGRWLEERGFAGRFDVQRRAEEVPVAEYVALAGATRALARTEGER
jgi:16S rRNA (adenine1518-N6/adenine1519-N6)-dimethyltransferase